MRRSILAVFVFALIFTSTAPAQSSSRALDRIAPQIDFRDVPMVDVFEYLRDTLQVNLFVNWPALEAAGIDPNQPINLRLRNVSYRKILDLVLSESGSGDLLSWYVADNVVHVTLKELADQDLVTRIYPVMDLLIEFPNFAQNAPDFDLGQTTSTGGGGQSPFGGGGTGRAGQKEDLEARAQKLIDLIMDVVEPDVWFENGGRSRIRFFQGNLIVTAPRPVQEKIGRQYD